MAISFWISGWFSLFREHHFVHDYVLDHLVHPVQIEISLNCFIITVTVIFIYGFCQMDSVPYGFVCFQFSTISVPWQHARDLLKDQFDFFKCWHWIGKSHFVSSGCCKDDKHTHKSDCENTEENMKSGILKKAKYASSKFRNSLKTILEGEMMLEFVK